MNYSSILLLLTDKYRASTGLSDARISKLLFNSGTRIRNIRRGAGLTVASLDHAVAWYSTHWPEDLDWPEDIPRPEVQHDAA